MREHNIAILQDTLDVCERGFYETETGRVDLKLDMEHMLIAEVYEPRVLDGFRSIKEFNHPNLKGRCSYSVVNTDSFTLAREIAEKTGKQVTITILSDRISYINYDPYCRQTAMLVEEMERVSGGMIKVEYTDIVRNPSFTDKYPDEELSKTDIIVSCADKYVHLTPAELFTFENYSGNGRLARRGRDQQCDRHSY